MRIICSILYTYMYMYFSMFVCNFNLPVQVFTVSVDCAFPHDDDYKCKVRNVPSQDQLDVDRVTNTA